jgi:hypothetical protein
MITGSHIIIYSKNPESDRQFFKDLLKLKFIKIFIPTDALDLAGRV